MFLFICTFYQKDAVVKCRLSWLTCTSASLCKCWHGTGQNVDIEISVGIGIDRDLSSIVSSPCSVHNPRFLCLLCVCLCPRFSLALMRTSPLPMMLPAACSCEFVVAGRRHFKTHSKKNSGLQTKQREEPEPDPPDTEVTGRALSAWSRVFRWFIEDEMSNI